MSLQVWLPLNGNLNNKGLSDVTITNNGATIENSGKIGQCYKFTPDATTHSGQYLEINKKTSDLIDNNGSFSLSCWFNQTDDGYSNGSGLIAANQYRENGFGLYVTSTLQLNFMMCSEDNEFEWWPGVSFTKNKWYHVSVTYDSKTKTEKMYLNGGLIGQNVLTINYTHHPSFNIKIGHGTQGGWTYTFPGLMNDVRIYDHCLSASEVKEISKGLVLHYPLNDPYEIRKENHQLINNGNFANNVDGWNWSGMKAGYVIANNTLSYTGTNYYSYFIKYLYNFDANHIYFFKCQYMHNYTTDIRWEGKHENGNGIYTKDMPASNSFVNFYHRFTALSTNPGTMLQVYGTSQTDSASISFKNCMLFDLTKMYGSGCEPDEETCKKIFTADYYSYIAAAYNVNNTITDCSGYGYNGTMDTNLSISAASPRYNLSTYFNGIDNCIVVPYNSVCPTNIYTMNVWFYKEHLGHKTYETLFGGPDGFEIDSRCGDSANLVLYREGGYSICQMDFNRWNMVTFVHDAVTEYYYVNGELKASREVKAMPVGEYYIGAWAAKTQQNYEGKMSDFRIYATALSANDIQELYNTSAKINKNGTLMCYEIKED